MILVDQIGAAKLFRGPRPTYQELKTVDVSVNLETGLFDFFHDLGEEEREWCHDLGVDYSHIPLSDFFTPALKDIRVIIDSAHYHLFKGRNVLVHCLHGEDRTGIIIAAYQIKYKKWSVEQALAEMFDMGFHKFPYIFWSRVLFQL